MDEAQLVEQDGPAAQAALENATKSLVEQIGASAQAKLEDVSDAARAALGAIGDLAESGATDQMRGYANETMGRAKMALGLAAQSPELTVAGVAQIAIGGAQRFIGQAKADADSPADEDSPAAASADG